MPHLSDLTCDPALEVVGLSPDRRQRLADHIAHTNKLRPADAAVAPAVAHCAALLLGDEHSQHVAAPTALALAETLCTLPSIGRAVTSLCAGAMSLRPSELSELGVSREALRRFLSQVVLELSALAGLLEPDTASIRRASVGGP